MNPLILDDFGISLSVQRSCLRVKEHGKLIHEFEPKKISYDFIILHSAFGSITIESLDWLSFHNIPILLMHKNGRIRSEILPHRFSTHGKIRLAQARAYDNLEQRLKISRAIMQAKTGKDFSFCKTIRAILMKEAEYDLNKFLKLKTEHFDKSKFCFESRAFKGRVSNNSASDEINALLNYSFSVLEALVRKAVIVYGLDSSIGFIHGIDEKKEPLVCDLQEPFRKVCEDSVCQVLPKISKRGFYRSETYTVMLRIETAKILIERIKDNLSQRHEFQNENRRIEGLVFLTAEILSQYLLGKRELSLPSLV